MLPNKTARSTEAQPHTRHTSILRRNLLQRNLQSEENNFGKSYTMHKSGCPFRIRYSAYR